MTTAASKEELIGALERSVSEVLAYYDGPGQATKARIDRWGAWDVLAHFLYWHYATTWGIQSAAVGGPPWKLSGSADQINEACLPMHQGESFEQLLGQLRRAQERLLRAARSAPSLQAPAFARPDGGAVTIGQRLETIARHWAGHLQALKEAS
ncbi:MAG: hypothetical protein HYY02_05070 [Chloroflexi bacterium]|nr:hypothetical protein [Chloroflexota bacterium]